MFSCMFVGFFSLVVDQIGFGTVVNAKHIYKCCNTLKPQSQYKKTMEFKVSKER